MCRPYFNTPLLYFPLLPFLNSREDENIQNLEFPSGPSLRNSCPRPLPHLLQDTFRALAPSGLLETLSGRTVCVKDGHGDECLNFDTLLNNS